MFLNNIFYVNKFQTDQCTLDETKHTGEKKIELMFNITDVNEDKTQRLKLRLDKSDFKMKCNLIISRVIKDLKILPGRLQIPLYWNFQSKIK